MTAQDGLVFLGGAANCSAQQLIEPNSKLYRLLIGTPGQYSLPARTSFLSPVSASPSSTRSNSPNHSRPFNRSFGSASAIKSSLEMVPEVPRRRPTIQTNLTAQTDRLPAGGATESSMRPLAPPPWKSPLSGGVYSGRGMLARKPRPLTLVTEQEDRLWGTDYELTPAAQPTWAPPKPRPAILVKPARPVRPLFEMVTRPTQQAVPSSPPPDYVSSNLGSPVAMHYTNAAREPAASPSGMVAHSAFEDDSPISSIEALMSMAPGISEHGDASTALHWDYGHRRETSPHKTKTRLRRASLRRPPALQPITGDRHISYLVFDGAESPVRDVGRQVLGETASDTEVTSASPRTRRRTLPSMYLGHPNLQSPTGSEPWSARGVEAYTPVLYARDRTPRDAMGDSGTALTEEVSGVAFELCGGLLMFLSQNIRKLVTMNRV